MRQNSLIKEVTYGICGSLVDLIIWQIALVGASVGKTGSRGVYTAFKEADEILDKINHRTLIATWHQLTKKRLITYKKRGHLYSSEITKFGQNRLKENFPQYHKKRPWDKRIYLITYDIPEKARVKRDKLRNFLLQIDARLLQESTFLTPYNPRELINEFGQKYKIPGNIIISDIGPDGGVGEMSIQDLLVKLYSLEKLDEKYEEFIKHEKEKNRPLRFLLFEYLSILKNDPQLPFSLLPKGWLGEKAYLLYEKLREKYIYSYAAA